MKKKFLLVSMSTYLFSLNTVYAEQLPCVDTQKTGSYLSSYMKQASVPKRMLTCFHKHLICMTTNKGNVIESNDVSEVKKSTEKITFGVIQVLKGKNSPFCAYGVFSNDEMSGASWLYRLENVSGDFSGDSTAEQTTPLTPAQFINVINSLNQ